MVRIVVLFLALLATGLHAQNQTSGPWTYTVSNGEATVVSYSGAGGTINIPSVLNTIPVKAIGLGAAVFGDFAEKTTISIPAGVTNIGSWAFYDCWNLEGVSIPGSVTVIGDGAFYACTSLTTINLPAGVTSIGEQAFMECSNLTSVSLPNTLTSVGHSVFYGCSSLGSITIPGSLANIEALSFSNCSNLVSVTIADGVTSIGFAAFSNCTRLASLSIASSVTSIGGQAFAGCTSLNIASATSGNFSYQVSGGEASIVGFSEEIFAGGSHTIPSEIYGIPVTKIGDGSNSLVGWSTPEPLFITISEGVTSIMPYAFRNSSNLRGIQIPNTVTNIGGDAFKNCVGLTSIILPSDLEELGNYTYLNWGGQFDGCTSLTNVTLPTNLTLIGGGVFARCSSLSQIQIPAGVTNIGSGAFEFAGLTNIPTKADGSACVEWINPLVFRGCRFTNLVIPSNVTVIGGEAFADCPDLTNVVIPNGFTGRLIGTFRGCTNLVSVTFGSPSEIGDSCFAGTRLTDLVIPNTVTNIGSSAFRVCRYLTNITIPGSVTNIGDYAFSFCENLKSINIPTSVKSVGTGAFANCLYLTNVAMAGGVTNVGWGSFSNCVRLRDISLPSSVQTVRSLAFSGCVSLTNLTIPNPAALIETGAFNNCNQLVLSLPPQYLAGTNLSSFGISGAKAGDSFVRSLADFLATNPVFIGNLAQAILAASNNYGLATQAKTQTEISAATASLASKEELTNALAQSRTDGINSVLSNPNLWTLYTTNQISAMAVGDLVLTRTNNGSFILNYDIEQSEDLVNWYPYQGFAMPLTNLPVNKAFVRIKAKQ